MADERPNEPNDDEDRRRLRRIDRLPPHDLQAEESLLGACLLSAAAIDAALDAGVGPGDFYKPAHGHIFAAVQALYGADHPVDAVTVADELKRQSMFDAIGNPAMLLALVAGTPATSSAGRYAAIVERHATSRRLAASAQLLVDAALTGDLDAAQGAAEAVVENLSLIGTPLATTWEAVNLTELLEGDPVVVRPTMLKRSDGECLLYPGKTHAFNAEPETGKSWLAKVACLEVMAAGEDVLYVDFESDAASILERLRDVGTDPALIAERFHYIRPDDPFDIVARAKLIEFVRLHRPALAVLDGVAEVMAMNNWSENDNAEIAKFLNAIPRLLEREGCTVILIDHLVKDRENQGRYARGGAHKLAGISGAAYRLESVRPFGRGRDGLSRIVVTKDRPGWIRQLAVRGERVAELHMPACENGDALALEVNLPVAVGEMANARDSEQTHWDGPTSCMEKVVELLRGQPNVRLSKSALRAAMKDAGHKFRNQTIDVAADRLAADDKIGTGAGPRNAVVFWWPVSNVMGYDDGPVPESAPDWDEDF